jgi:hypothetical protein
MQEKNPKKLGGLHHAAIPSGGNLAIESLLFARLRDLQRV